jgi:hypothetical protein
MRNSDAKDQAILDATATQMRAFWARTAKLEDGCIVWTGTLTHGYGRAKLNKEDVKAHRVALVRSEGRVLTGLMARHKCRKRSCCNVNHLEFGTARDNVHDRYRDGTMKAPRYGEQHFWCKFTRDQIRAAYMTYAAGNTTYEAVGQKFGMNFTQVEQLIKRRIWKEALADLPDCDFDTTVANKARGEKQHLSKLKDADVLHIRAALKEGGGLKEVRRLAALYGVHWSNIYGIKSRKTWKHLP